MSAIVFRLTERAQQSRGMRVDRHNARLNNVMLLGWKSQNSRTYDPDGVDPALYVNRPVNAGHSRGPERPIGDRLGWVSEAWKTDRGIFGTVQLLKSHPMTATLLEIAEGNPTLLGFSHTATGEQGQSGRIGKVSAVESCDLVTSPASTPGMFLESRQAVAGAPATPANLGRWLAGDVRLRESARWSKVHAITERLNRGSPARAKAFREMAEAGLVGADPMADAVSGVTAPMTAEQMRRKKLAKALAAVLRDESLSLESAVKKAAELLDDPDAIPDEPNEWDGPREESVTFRPASPPLPGQALREARAGSRRLAERHAHDRTVPQLADAAAVGRWLNGR